MTAVSGYLVLLADVDGHHAGDGWWVAMVIGMVLFWGLVLLGGIWLARELIQRRDHSRDPLQLLDRRLAEGTISPEEYRERREILSASSEGRKRDA